MMPVYPGKACSHLDDHASRERVMISTCQQRRASRTAECRCMKAVVGQSILCEFGQIWRFNWPAERRTHAKTNIVQQDQQDIRAACSSLDWLRIAGNGIFNRLTDFAFEFRIRLRQLGLGDGIGRDETGDQEAQ